MTGKDPSPLGFLGTLNDGTGPRGTAPSPLSSVDGRRRLGASVPRPWGSNLQISSEQMPGASNGECDLALDQARFSQRSPYVAFDPVEVRHLPQILTELLIPTALVVVDARLELLRERGGVQPAMCRLLAK